MRKFPEEKRWADAAAKFAACRTKIRNAGFIAESGFGALGSAIFRARMGYRPRSGGGPYLVSPLLALLRGFKSDSSDTMTGKIACRVVALSGILLAALTAVRPLERE